MKHIQPYRIYENKQAINKLIQLAIDKGISIDMSDIDYLKKITSESKTPNNLYKLIKWLSEGHAPHDISVVYDYYLNLRANNQKVPDINKYNEPEDLYDDLQILEREYMINKMVQEFPSKLKLLYKGLSDKSEIDALLYQLSKKDEKGQLIRKISRYDTLDELVKVLYNFTNSSKGFVDTLISLQNDPYSDVVYYKDNVIVAIIKDYSTSCKMGSSSWCISTEASMWDSYVNENNLQYFIWDFNLRSTDPLSLIGITTYNFEHILSNPYGNQISSAQDRNDGSVISRIEDILRRKNIPLEVIYFDVDNTEGVLNMLNRMEPKVVFSYLTKIKKESSFFELLPKIYEHYDKEDNVKTAKFCLEVLESSKNIEGRNLFYDERFSVNRLIRTLNKLVTVNTSILFALFKEYSQSKPLYDYIQNNYRLFNAEHIIEQINNKGNDLKIESMFSDLLIKIIKHTKDTNNKFSLINLWRDKGKFRQKELLPIFRTLIKNNFNDFNVTNKIIAYKLTKLNWKAAELFSNLKDSEVDINLLKGITNNKPYARYKNDFITNIFNYIKRLEKLDTSGLLKLLKDYSYSIDFEYFGNRLKDLFDILKTNSCNFEIKMALFDIIYKFKFDTLSDIRWDVLKMIEENSDMHINSDHYRWETFKNSTKEEIEENSELVEKILERNKSNYRTLQYSLLLGVDKYIRKYVNLNNIKFNLNELFFYEKLSYDVFVEILENNFPKDDYDISFVLLSSGGNGYILHSVEKFMYCIHYFGLEEDIDTIAGHLLNTTYKKLPKREKIEYKERFIEIINSLNEIKPIKPIHMYIFKTYIEEKFK